MATNNDRVRLLMRGRGYIVLGSPAPKKIGQVVDAIKGRKGGELEQPFYVTMQTNREDAEAQQEILNRSDDDIDTVGDHSYFYRLTTD